MAEINLTAAFSSVLGPDQEAIKRLLTETVEQLAQEDKTFTAPSWSHESTSAAGSRRAGRRQEGGRPLPSSSTCWKTPRPERARAPSQGGSGLLCVEGQR